MKYIELSRKELYLLVWKTSITKLAEEHNIPADTIRNICKKLEIPTPSSGYWSKLKFKKSVEILPLPKLKNHNKETGLKLIDGKLTYEEHFQTTFYRIKKEIETKYQLPTKTPKKLIKPHPLIKAAKEDLKNYKHPNGWMFKEHIRYTSQNIINIQVSKNNIFKALCFMDAFLKLIEKRNHTIEINGYHTDVIIFNERIRIKCREILKRIKTKDLNSRFNSEYSELIPSGIIAFEIDKSYWKSEWRESTTKPLETKLSSIVANLELKAKKQIEERIEREKWHIESEKKRKIEEAFQKQKDDEFVNFENLFQSATRWHKSQYLRNYIKEFTEYTNKTNTLDETKKHWIKWATEKADWYDPFIEKNVALLEDIDRDTLKSKRYRYW